EPQAANALRPQRTGLYARSRYRRAARGREVRPEGQLDQRRRHEQVVAELRPTDGLAPVLDPEAGREREGHLPRGARLERRATGGLLAGPRPILRADEPRLHGL